MDPALLVEGLAAVGMTGLLTMALAAGSGSEGSSGSKKV